jgi:DNA-binding NarL/FixJ family response regulator
MNATAALGCRRALSGMRALIIDDHPLIQDAVANILRRIDAGACIDAAADCERGLAMARRGDEIDLVLLDLTLPGLSGIPALKRLRAAHPDVPVVVLSAICDPATVRAAIGGGAVGFIPKSSSNEVMETALRLVIAGGRYLPPQILSDAGRGALAPVREDSPGAATLGLTARQFEVLRLVAQGAPNKVICRELGLAERTVKAHVTAVLRALQVSSRTQAAIAAARLGVAVDSRPASAP